MKMDLNTIISPYIDYGFCRTDQGALYQIPVTMEYAVERTMNSFQGEVQEGVICLEEAEEGIYWIYYTISMNKAGFSGHLKRNFPEDRYSWEIEQGRDLQSLLTARAAEMAENVPGIGIIHFRKKWRGIFEITTIQQPSLQLVF